MSADCPHPSHGPLCAECQVERQFADVDFGGVHDCPDCGRETSGDGVICARCRRGDDL